MPLPVPYPIRLRKSMAPLILIHPQPQYLYPQSSTKIKKCRVLCHNMCQQNLFPWYSTCTFPQTRTMVPMNKNNSMLDTRTHGILRFLLKKRVQPFPTPSKYHKSQRYGTQKMKKDFKIINGQPPKPKKEAKEKIKGCHSWVSFFFSPGTPPAHIGQM